MAGYCCLLALVGCLASERSAAQGRTGQAHAAQVFVRLKYTLAAGSVETFAVSPTGRLVALTDKRNNIQIWNPTTGALLQQLDGVGDPAAWSADGQMLFTLSRKQKALQVWSL